MGELLLTIAYILSKQLYTTSMSFCEYILHHIIL